MRLDRIESIRWIDRIRKDDFGADLWLVHVKWKPKRGWSMVNCYRVCSRQVERWSTGDSYQEEAFFKSPPSDLREMQINNLIVREYRVDRRMHSFGGEDPCVCHYEIRVKRKG